MVRLRAHVTIDLAEHGSGIAVSTGFSEKKKTERFSWKIDIFMAWPTWLVFFRHPSEKWWSELKSGGMIVPFPINMNLIGLFSWLVGGIPTILQNKSFVNGVGIIP